MSIKSLFDKIFSPTVIPENQFPGKTQTIDNASNPYTTETYTPTEIDVKDFILPTIATGLRSTTLDTQRRQIMGGYTFSHLGAITIGNYANGSGSGISISPQGIIGVSGGVTKFSLSNTGIFVTSGYIQVGGAASDVNGGVTLIGAGKVLISGSTNLSNWSAGGDATFIDGGKLYTGTVTADTVRSSWVYAGNISANQITTGSLSADRISGGTLQIGGSADYLGTIVVKNSGGTEITKLNSAGVIVRNTRGLFFEGTTGGTYWDFQVNNANQAVTSLPTSNQFFMRNYAGNDNYFTVSIDRAFHKNEFQANKITSNSGELALDPEGTNKVGFYGNIDMKNNNIDECTDIWAYNFFNRSDLSLKKDVTNRTDSLEIIKQLRPVAFRFKDEKKDKPNHMKRIGLIAQEVEAILPEVVMSDENGVRGINYNELIPVIIGAIRELEAKLPQ